MQKKFSFKRTASVVLIGAMCTLAGGTALADTGSSSVQNNNPSPVHQCAGHAFGGSANQNMEQNIQDILSSMVDSGTISQAQSDAVLQYIKDQFAARQAQGKSTNGSAQEGTTADKTAQTPRTDFFAAIVQQNILTSDQANALKQQLQQKEQQERQDAMTNKLDALVSAGTINQDQVTKIESYLTSQTDSMKADFEKMKGMSANDREAYFKQLKENNVNPLVQMVNDGIITQQQSDAIAQAIHSGAARGGDRATNASNMVQKAIDNLVADNTITQQQADVIQGYVQKAITAWKDKNTDGSTPQDRSAVMQQIKTAGQDLLTQLVNDQVITQDQADAITKYFTDRSANGFAHHGTGHGSDSQQTNSDTATDN